VKNLPADGGTAPGSGSAAAGPLRIITNIATGCLDAGTSVSGGGSLSALAERLLLVIYAYPPGPFAAPVAGRLASPGSPRPVRRRPGRHAAHPDALAGEPGQNAVQERGAVASRSSAWISE
jgi:hypothetical protein